MRHLGVRLLTRAYVGHQQARVDEGVHHASFLRRQLGERYAAPGHFLPPHGDESEQHLQHEVDAFVSAAEFRHSVVSLTREGAGDAAEAVIELLRHRLTGTGGEVQLLQQIREQRQRVVRAHVVDDGLHNARREGQTNEGAGSLHHLGELVPAQRADGDRVLEELGVTRTEELSQELHPKRGEHPDPRILGHAGMQRLQELGTLPLPGEGNDLFELVDYDEHVAEPASAQPRQLRRQGGRVLPQAS
ncbi:hypothetical protein QQY66_17875 [Streptomyces sp. DG2A-72]|nr:hypothetical protein [Streptomyces sp. DG2A-72]MDO0933463.1 hypothetical protein [Streptomyces sp. DG2A-72]